MALKEISIERKNKIVGYWLLLGVFMIIVQTILGGITRLSGSGLSITEWNVVTGALPPLNNKQWLIEFQKYQNSPQFRYLNADFSLYDFKHIFFWEWFHRLWARTLGVVFAIPFIYFIIKRYFNEKMIMPLLILFLLGGLQGAIGWIMVASGLIGDATYVAPTKLTVHFVCAMVLACYTLWFALSLLIPNHKRIANQGLMTFYLITIVLLFLQLTYGALLAGHKAATVAATWPKINGDWIPDNLLASKSGHPFIENKILIHFIHRNVAYTLFLIICIGSFIAFNTEGTNTFKKFRKWPLILVCCQILLGILTLINATAIHQNQWGVFETMGLLHQLVAMLLMMSILTQIYICSKRDS